MATNVIDELLRSVPDGLSIDDEIKVRELVLEDAGPNDVIAVPVNDVDAESRDEVDVVEIGVAILLPQINPT